MFLAEIRREAKSLKWKNQQLKLINKAVEVLTPFEGTASQERHTNPEFAQALALVEGCGFDYFIYSWLEIETAGQQSLDLNPFRELKQILETVEES